MSPNLWRRRERVDYLASKLACRARRLDKKDFAMYYVWLQTVIERGEHHG